LAEPIIPIWKKLDEDTGQWIFGLSPTDADRVAAGYACARCLEPFEFYVAKCPVCGEANVPNILPTPAGWK
jgi:hypothetical protein